MSQADDPDLSGESDEVLSRADAFMRRRRAPSPPPLDDDIPLLTDIVPTAPIKATKPTLPPAPAGFPAPAPIDMEAEIAHRVAERLESTLAEYRQDLAISLDDWLNFDLPRLITREIDGVADRIVEKAGEELRVLLQAPTPPKGE